MKNWKLTDTDFYDDNYEEYEYARKVMWKNHEIKIVLSLYAHRFTHKFVNIYINLKI